MGQLFENIRQAVREEWYFFGDHADNMLRERGIVHWQVADGLQHATLLSERSGTRPNPTIEVEQILADGTPVKAVWGFVSSLNQAKLVTIHFYDR